MAGKIVVSTLNNDTGVLATQNGMTGIAKAWVQFVGSTATVNGSFNISSVTRTAAGRYTITFTTAMPNANYAPVGMVRNDQTNGNRGAGGIQVAEGTTPTASSFQVLTAFGAASGSNGAAYDVEFAYLAVFSS